MPPDFRRFPETAPHLLSLPSASPPLSATPCLFSKTKSVLHVPGPCALPMPTLSPSASLRLSGNPLPFSHASTPHNPAAHPFLPAPSPSYPRVGNALRAVRHPQFPRNCPHLLSLPKKFIAFHLCTPGTPHIPISPRNSPCTNGVPFNSPAHRAGSCVPTESAA